MLNDALTILKKRGTSKTLVVIVHGYQGSPNSMRYVQQIVESQMADADIYTPTLPYTSLRSMVRAIDIVQALLDAVDACWADRMKRTDQQAYERLIFVGTSTGGLMVRKLYIHACGEMEGAPFEKEIRSKTPKIWSTKVDRIILLAGMNRGWAVTHHFEDFKAIRLRLASWIANVLSRMGMTSTMLDLRRGAPFITDLRVQWLYLFRHNNEKGSETVPTIQLLGSMDGLVPPQDKVDLISGADFIYLDVPYSNHHSVLVMDESSNGKGRAAVFSKVLTEDTTVLRNQQEAPADLTELIQPRPDVTDVTFVIHGIRDEGYWTHKIARRIKTRARVQAPERTFASETSSYGYFPIFDFLRLGQRAKKVHWLMDQYVEALAMYPNAVRFSYVGHSNGTYLLAKALKDYACCQFENVVFASSVVRTDYDWETPIREGKVKSMLNFVATNDYVVAWAPYCFESIWFLRFLDLGGAGHVGFQSKAVHQIQYVKGAHSASREEDNWNSIADFVINGPPAKASEQIIENEQSGLFTFLTALGRFGFFILLATAIVLFLGYGIGYGIWFLLQSKPLLTLQILIVIVLLYYLSKVVQLLKRF